EWTPVQIDIRPYNQNYAGRPVWNNIAALGSDPGSPYVLTAASLKPYIGDAIELRIGFYATRGRTSAGTYIDEISVHEEASDPDGDGLPGVISEYTSHGTRPFFADTDGDGPDDGQELNIDQTSPLNPADFLGARTLTAPFEETFEGTDDGGLATDTNQWEYGAPASGPGSGYTGGRVWATNLGGNYTPNVREYLYMPAVDLSGTTDPTLSFRLWMRNGLYEPHGVTVEFLNSSGEWTTFNVGTPQFINQQFGRPIWDNLTPFTFVAVPLEFYTESTIWIRFGLLANGGRSSDGAYIDDIRIQEESTDPDGDGLIGILDEFSAHGTDPYLADTDGDGTNDGDEVANGTDPLAP
ncbi:MAG: thrombospondin type 3 repeat-containing protein, partial [Myxococcota bacterium]